MQLKSGSKIREGSMSDILIIGGASLDTLHFLGRTELAAGGAGMYTAAAAHRMGACVTVFAPRPEPMPALLLPLMERVTWVGPIVSPDQLPRFEITHHGNGRTELVNATFGDEVPLDPSTLPEDLSQYGIVHLTPVGSAQHQLAFLEACRQRGAKRISVGTFPCIVEDETECVREIFEIADLFFMNEAEAVRLLGSVDSARSAPGRLLMITLGDRGAWVILGDHRTHVPALTVTELDPTGAGDTFCGAMLAGLIQGQHPLMAARDAMVLAGHMITQVGPTALWDEKPLLQGALDDRVAINKSQIGRVADLIDHLPHVTPFDFTGPGLPPVAHPAALDYFFTGTLQQFGFWHLSDGRYARPMIARIDGSQVKGSDYLWRAYLRKLNSGDSVFFRPQSQAQLTREDMLALFRADDGEDPLPVLESHLAQAQSYGKDMLSLGLTPEDVVARANGSLNPLQTFLEQLNHIGGYKEDPLRKKAVLLAMILAQRPEHFLHLRESDPIPPIIDYHLMRSCLRIGLLDIVDSGLEEKLRQRIVLQPGEEWAVRHAAFEAVQKVVDVSGKSMGAVDWFFFDARRRCPEMREPECKRCPMDPVCAHRKALFQPVLRTTFY
jgi:sugar/nucleoside kinase (ribokinase family)